MFNLNFFWEYLIQAKVALGVAIMPAVEMIWEEPEFAIEQMVLPELIWNTKQVITIRANRIPPNLAECVDLLHRKRREVKFSFNGSLLTEDMIEAFVAQVAEFVAQNNLDGIDLRFDQESFSPQIQYETILAMRDALGKKKSISYSIPVSCIDAFHEVIEETHEELTQITLFDFKNKKCDFEDEYRRLWELGVPSYKTALMLEIGLHRDGRGKTTVADCKKVARMAHEQGLCAVVLDSFQRDTDHRPGVPIGEGPDQTGLADGTFFKIAYKTLAGY